MCTQVDIQLLNMTLNYSLFFSSTTVVREVGFPSVLSIRSWNSPPVAKQCKYASLVSVQYTCDDNNVQYMYTVNTMLPFYIHNTSKVSPDLSKA